MAKKEFPEQAETISMAMTPMVLTARLVKKMHPECKIAFIGPCLSKKNEASRRTVKSYVDFVLTFEELGGMFDAQGVVFEDLEEGDTLRRASSDGFGFAISGGVAQAVVNHIKRVDPDREVKIVKAEGLDECKKMMKKAAAGEYNGYLLEGMACPGGCVNGGGQPYGGQAGTVEKSKKLYDVDLLHSIRRSEENPVITTIYQEIIKGKDIFIGVSAPNLVSAEMVSTMAKDAIVFAMANPTPEIMPDVAKEGGARVVATGRSDFPNQINNVLVFPGIFRGALDVKAKDITEEMKLAASRAIASLITDEELNEEYIIPSAFDKRVCAVVAKEVGRVAREQGITKE
jgi:hypothetical protein